jgi:nickel transport protein
MHRKSSGKRLKGLLLLLALWLPSAEAEAHRVNLFAYVDDGQVYTESYFADGSPVNHGQILVADATGREILTGETDAAGQFRFPLPQEQNLTILLKAAMGHRAEYLLPLKEEER